MDTSLILQNSDFVEIIRTGTNHTIEYLINKGLGDEQISIKDKEIEGRIILMPDHKVEHRLVIKNVTFKESLNFGGTLFEKSVRFQNCIFNEKVTIGLTIFNRNGTDNKNTVTTFNEEFIFKNCIFKNGLNILNGSFNSFYSEDSTFLRSESAMHGLGNSIYIQGGHFKQGFAILGGKVDDNVHINGGYFAMQFYFGRNAIITSQIIITQGVFKSIHANDAKIDYFKVYGAYKNFIPVLTIGKGIKKLEIPPIQESYQDKPLFIKKLEFSDTPESVIISEKCIIGELFFSNHASSTASSFALVKPKIGKVYFLNYNNYGKLVITGIKPRIKKSEIISENSNLGIIDFISCDLSIYELIIDDSKLVNIFYTSTIFPKIIKSQKHGIENYRQLRDTYDQLQTIAVKQGDRVASLNWQHSSLMYYFKTVRPFVERKWYVLLFMKISNNFRGSSGLAIFFTLLSGFILFSFYSLATDYEFQFGIPETNDIKRLVSSTDKHLEYYWEFLNPTHKKGFMDIKQNSPGWANFFDILGRVVIGFGIYQFIQAFRRYGKSE